MGGGRNHVVLRVAMSPRSINYRSRRPDRHLTGSYLLFGALHVACCLSHDFTRQVGKKFAVDKQTN